MLDVLTTSLYGRCGVLIFSLASAMCPLVSMYHIAVVLSLVQGYYGLLSDWQLSASEAIGVSAMLRMLCPAVHTLCLGEQIVNMVHSLAPWQHLQSLNLPRDTTQSHMAAMGRLTQLTALTLDARDSTSDWPEDPLNLACLAALVGLQSLSLSHMEQLTGLPFVAQACSGITRLALHAVSLPLLNPAHQQPAQPPCSWPSLVELEIHNVSPGVVSTVLPTAQAAPILAQLRVDGEDEGRSWLPDMQGHAVSIRLAYATNAEQIQALERLAVDCACLAAVSGAVRCRALYMGSFNHSAMPPGFWARFAKALRPLGPTLTHLEMMHVPSQIELGWARELALALPKLQRFEMYTEDKEGIPIGIGQLLLYCPSLKTLIITGAQPDTCSSLFDLLANAALLCAISPQRVLELRLGVLLYRTMLEQAAEVWRELSAKLPGPSSVMVTNDNGCDILRFLKRQG